MSKIKNEQVLVVPENTINFRVFTNGFFGGEPGFFNSILSKATFMARDKAETDETHKQLIPYCVIKRNNEIFTYQRTVKGGENRLHAKWSLGVGGHVNPVDETVKDHRVTYYSGLARELKEEVDLHGGYGHRTLGYLYLTNSPVDRVHLGCIHLVEIDGLTNLDTAEDCLDNCGFKNYKQLIDNKSKFENWSQIVIEQLHNYL